MKKPISKNKSRPNKKYTDAEMKRYVGVILEEVRDGFKAQTEHTSGVNQRLDNISKTLDSHSEQIGGIFVDINVIKIEVAKISHDVKLQLDKKVDKKLFLDLDSQVTKLEKK